MFNRIKRSPRLSITSAITRRWIRSRPGSVLILVIALLVLLALIGTAYLSSTQTERYTSNQNAVNTEADLLIQGLVDTVNGQITGALYGTTSTGTQYRPPQSQLVSTVAYKHYTSTGSDLYLADRLPAINANTTVPTWNSISWPLFADSSANATFDSPFDNSVNAYLAINKEKIVAIPTYKVINGQTYPGMIYFVPAPTAAVTLQVAGGGPVTVNTPNGAYLTSSGVVQVFGAIPSPATVFANPASYPNLVNFAANSSGDGIADGGFAKLPVGQLNGITYYAGIRVIDNNSAFNVNTALSSATDYATLATSAATPTPVDGLGVATAFPMPTTAAPLGVFRSHVGLMQVLPDYNLPSNPNDSPDMENVLRYLSQEVATAPAPLLDNKYTWSSAPPDSAPSVPRTDFTFMSVGDHLGSQIGRRQNNPGYFTYNGAPYLHAAFSMNDTASVAYRFSLHNALLSSSSIETQMPDSLLNANVQATPYNPSAVATWYSAVTTLASRTMVVANNAVSDFIPTHSVTATGVPLNPAMLPYSPPAYDTSGSTTYLTGQFVQFTDKSIASQPARCYVALASVATAPVSVAGVPDTVNWRLEEAWTTTPVKAGINTADFATLWRAFYNIIADTGDTIPPVPGGAALITNTGLGWGPFRNPKRTTVSNAANTITSGQMLQIRAALAAVNAMDMRNNNSAAAVSPNLITSRTFKLYADSTNTATKYVATVYGLEKQPFITAVVADYDGAAPTGLSIELYNPTDVAIDISNWQLGFINRAAVGGILSISSASTTSPSIPAGTSIPAGGYLLVQSTAATNMMAGAGEAVLNVDGIQTATDPAAPGEIVLLRPHRVDNTYTTLTAPFDNIYNEGAAIAPQLDQLVPVDMIDFTGVFATGTPGRRIYERPHGVVSDTVQYDWQFVYPGKYDTAATPAQSGWGAVQNPPNAVPPVGGAASNGTALGGNNPVSFQPIQLATSNWVGPSPANATTGNTFPFGGFARNGDMLKVPFIGAYVIRPDPGAAGQFIAMNSITLDASQADAYNGLPSALQAADLYDEAIGRFCPLTAIDPAQALYTSGTNSDPYGWAADFFDYLDVQAASDDFFPNVDPRLADGSMPSATNLPTAANLQKYPNTGTPTGATLLPSAVANSTSASANGTPEQTAGKQGLININTASAYVLQQLPGVSTTMAAQIVADRTANGPFKTIFDLNRVGVGAVSGDFQTREGNMKIYANPTSTTPGANFKLSEDPGLAEGDFTPASTVLNDGVRGDFEERTLMLNRISNLITTRSDTFTAYVLLQGWRNVGTGNPTLAVQRRAAFLVDRNSVTPSSNTVINFKVPTQ